MVKNLHILSVIHPPPDRPPKLKGKADADVNEEREKGESLGVKKGVPIPFHTAGARGVHPRKRRSEKNRLGFPLAKGSKPPHASQKDVREGSVD